MLDQFRNYYFRKKSRIQFSGRRFIKNTGNKNFVITVIETCEIKFIDIEINIFFINFKFYFQLLIGLDYLLFYIFYSYLQQDLIADKI